MRSKCILLIGIVSALFVTQGWAVPANFPAKPIQLWVGFPPGGPNDMETRALCYGASKALGKPIIVSNKPGGGGLLALELLKLEEPDGYTLANITDTPLTRTPHMMKVKFDALKDFTFLIRTTVERSTLVVQSDSPFKKFQDMIDFARKNPGKLTIGVSGYGTSRHIALEQIAKMENVKFQYVFFTGASPVLIALLGGHIMVGNMGPTAWLPHFKAGAVKPLLRWEAEPMPGVADLPSQGELYKFPAPPSNAHLIIAPKGIPKPIADKLLAALIAGTKTPQYTALAEQLSFIKNKMLSGNELNQWVEANYNLYGKLIGDLGIKAAPEK